MFAAMAKLQGVGAAISAAYAFFTHTYTPAIWGLLGFLAVEYLVTAYRGYKAGIPLHVSTSQLTSQMADAAVILVSLGILSTFVPGMTIATGGVVGALAAQTASRVYAALAGLNIGVPIPALSSAPAANPDKAPAGGETNGQTKGA